MLSTQTKPNTKVRRASDGAIVKVASITATAYKNVDSKVLYELVTVDENGIEDKALFAESTDSYKTLYSDPYYKDGDSFFADDLSMYGYYVGYPFTTSSVTDLIDYAKEYDNSIWNTHYLILTAFGHKLDLAKGTSEISITFTNIHSKEYVFSRTKEELSVIKLQPLRRHWTSYDPDVLK